MGLQVAGLPFLELHLEPPALIDGIVQFGEGVCDLLAADVEFETVGQRGVLRVSAGEGRDVHGVMGDDGRLDKVLLHRFIEDRHQHLARRVALPHLDPKFPGMIGHSGGVVEDGRFHAADLHDGIADGEPPPGGGQVDLFPLVAELE